MTSAANKILDGALALPEEAREELLTTLSASLRPVELSPAWHAEIARRLANIESGEAVVLDAETHFAELRAKLG